MKIQCQNITLRMYLNLRRKLSSVNCLLMTSGLAIMIITGGCGGWLLLLLVVVAMVVAAAIVAAIVIVVFLCLRPKRFLPVLNQGQDLKFLGFQFHISRTFSAVVQDHFSVGLK